MEMLNDFLRSLFDLSNAMAPYILFGLVFAGILHELVPQSLVTKHLGKGNVLSVLKSTFFGIPLPVCSCGVIPLAASIKKSGASKGSTLSFLISAPITGVDSIFATYGMFGWIFTLYRVLSSMFIAIFAGILLNIFDDEKQKNETKFSFSNNPNLLKPSVGTVVSFSQTQTSYSETERKKFSLKSALKYSFVTLLGDIAKPLFWGLILGAVISVAIPQNLSTVLVEHAWISYIIAVAIAAPMYVCATASLPIAAALMLSGVSPGAAFVFLSAGPATNIVTMGVVKNTLGIRSLFIYLGSIVAGSLIFGLGLDFIFDVSNIDPLSIISIEESSNFLTILSSVLLWGFILYFMLKPNLDKITIKR